MSDWAKADADHADWQATIRRLNRTLFEMSLPPLPPRTPQGARMTHCWADEAAEWSTGRLPQDPRTRWLGLQRWSGDARGTNEPDMALYYRYRMEQAGQIEDAARQAVQATVGHPEGRKP